MWWSKAGVETERALCSCTVCYSRGRPSSSSVDLIFGVRDRAICSRFVWFTIPSPPGGCPHHATPSYFRTHRHARHIVPKWLHDPGQSGGGGSCSGRHSLDRPASREERKGLQSDAGGGGADKGNDHGVGDADHRPPGRFSRRASTKGSQGAGVGRLASGVHPTAAATAKPGRTFAGGAAAAVDDGRCRTDGRRWAADSGADDAGKHSTAQHSAL